jgi:hypothetical protein
MKIMFWKGKKEIVNCLFFFFFHKSANCHWTSSGLQSMTAFFTSGKFVYLHLI